MAGKGRPVMTDPDTPKHTPSVPQRRMKWTRELIKYEIQKRMQSGLSLVMRDVTKSRLDLLSAAAYHFGSWKKAVYASGIKYDDIVQRPKWSKEKIIAAI